MDNGCGSMCITWTHMSMWSVDLAVHHGWMWTALLTWQFTMVGPSGETVGLRSTKNGSISEGVITQLFHIQAESPMKRWTVLNKDWPMSKQCLKSINLSGWRSDWA